MTLTYDFDIFDVVPPDVDADPELQAFLIRNGLQKQLDTQQIALFRSEDTAEALRKAPAPLRNYLIESGFGLNTYDSGAPYGRYPARDEEARLALIARLTENAPRFDLSEADAAAGGFSLSDFLAHLAEAAPIDWPSSHGRGGLDAISDPVPKTQSLISMAANAALAGVSARLARGVPLWGQLRRAASSA